MSILQLSRSLVRLQTPIILRARAKPAWTKHDSPKVFSRSQVSHLSLSNCLLFQLGHVYAKCVPHFPLVVLSWCSLLRPHRLSSSYAHRTLPPASGSCGRGFGPFV